MNIIKIKNMGKGDIFEYCKIFFQNSFLSKVNK